MIAPRGDIGCRCEQVLVDELQRLSTVAHQVSRLVAAVLVQTPMTVGIALTPDGSIFIFDSHSHGAHGALVATVCIGKAGTAVGQFLASLDGQIADGHLCVMAL